MTNVIQAELRAHPAEPPLQVEAVRVRLARTGPGTLALRYEIEGPSNSVTLPLPAPPLRADRLWETTCFELFVAPATGGGYREFNFSPSGQWAAYEFTGWRQGMRQTAVAAPPSIQLSVEPRRIMAEILLSADFPKESCRVGLFAIMAEGIGRRSFWAHAHAGSEPDFHHPACFSDDLPPAPRP